MFFEMAPKGELELNTGIQTARADMKGLKFKKQKAYCSQIQAAAMHEGMEVVKLVVGFA